MIMTISRKTASGNLLCDAGSSIQCSVTTWGVSGEGEKRGFRREGTYVYLWLIHVEV